MLRVIGIGGYRKSGKTEIIEKLVGELANRGYRVGTIKHIPTKGFTIDQQGTDTWRHAKAGSEKVIYISPGEMGTIEKREADVNRVLKSLLDLDFVILEGFRESENIAKIMTARSEEEAPELDDEFTIGFIGYGVKGKPVLDRGNIGAITDLVEEKTISLVGGLDCKECGYESCREFALAALAGNASKDGCRTLHGKVKLTVDGRGIPLKSFMQDLIAGVVKGMLSSLKQAEGERIELRVMEGGER